MFVNRILALNLQYKIVGFGSTSMQVLTLGDATDSVNPISLQVNILNLLMEFNVIWLHKQVSLTKF